MSSIACIVILMVCTLLYVSAAKKVKHDGDCPGYCTSTAADCYKEGGHISGRCSTLKYCCDNTDAAKERVGSCGAFKPKGIKPFLIFRSPNYPQKLHGNLICDFTFELEEDVAGVMIEFAAIKMDGFKPGAPNHECDQDIMYLRGFEDWVPPGFCGNLGGYKLFVDESHLEDVKNLTILAAMASKNYLWTILVTQIQNSSCASANNPPVPTVTTTQATARLPSRDSLEDAVKGVPYFLDQTPIPIEPLVVNGKNTVLGKVPWQASLRMRGARANPRCDASEGFHFCGGSIISDREILTAAHCVYLESKAMVVQPLVYYQIFLGDINNCHDADADEDAVQIFDVESITLHFAYERTVIMNDLAIIRLNESIQFDDNVKPIKLASTDDEFYGHDASVSGWGRTNLNDIKNKGSVLLQHGDNLMISDSKHCRAEVERISMDHSLDSEPKYEDIYDSVLCIKTKNTSSDVGVAQGDSGGPLVSTHAHSTEPILVGVTSYGIFPTQGGRIMSSINVFQSVAFFRRWIDVALCSLHETKV